MYGKSEFLASKTKLAQEAEKRQTTDQIERSMRFLEQAEVSQEALMADPHWRHYQQMVQGAIEQTKTHLETLKRSLEHPDLTEESEIQRVRNQLFICRARIEAWEVAISLPKSIIENAEQARERLKQFVDA